MSFALSEILNLKRNTAVIMGLANLCFFEGYKVLDTDWYCLQSTSWYAKHSCLRCDRLWSAVGNGKTCCVLYALLQNQLNWIFLFFCFCRVTTESFTVLEYCTIAVEQSNGV